MPSRRRRLHAPVDRAAQQVPPGVSRCLPVTAAPDGARCLDRPGTPSRLPRPCHQDVPGEVARKTDYVYAHAPGQAPREPSLFLSLPI